MVALVEGFDEALYSENRSRFYDSLAFCEDGRASERCADWIIEKLS
ncbi:MAG: hypothetical protein IJ046_04475 [Clostridia bacterium]|nr:hypothetical protein [Clostridia bacterium]